MLFTAVAVLGTQSRGAFLAISAMGLVLWCAQGKGAGGDRHRDDRPGADRLHAGLVGGADADDRGDSQDGSAWAASTPGRWPSTSPTTAPLGGGFFIYTPEVFGKYAPVPDDVHAAHSIYFQILGEHGYVGLALFLMVGVFTYGRP